MFKFNIMVGPSNSGKTTYIKNFMKDGDIAFHRDEYRERIVGDKQWTKKLEEEVYQTFCNDISDCARKLYSTPEIRTIWIDQTSLYPSVRLKILNNIPTSQALCVTFTYIENNVETSVRWNQNYRNGDIPEKVIRDHYKGFIPITQSELKSYESTFNLRFNLTIYNTLMRKLDCHNVIDYNEVYEDYCEQYMDCRHCPLAKASKSCTKPTPQTVDILQSWADNRRKAVEIQTALNNFLKEKYTVVYNEGDSSYTLKQMDE